MAQGDGDGDGTGAATPAAAEAVERAQRIRASSPAQDAEGSFEVPDPGPVAEAVQDGSKPDPDPFLASAEHLGKPVENAVIVGDSIWDMPAARRCRGLGVGLLSGGYGTEEPERSGAVRV